MASPEKRAIIPFFRNITRPPPVTGRERSRAAFKPGFSANAEKPGSRVVRAGAERGWSAVRFREPSSLQAVFVARSAIAVLTDERRCSTQVTPQGSPAIGPLEALSGHCRYFGAVSSVGRAPALQAGCHRFKSCTAHQKTTVCRICGRTVFLIRAKVFHKPGKTP